MASKVERPIIMPLSNPTSKCEALPEDLIRWTEGRALVATGSPFPPVTYEGHTYRIAQANNALIFPGLGLGVAVAKASRINEPMLEAAADAVAELSDAMTLGAALLPPVENLRMVSAAVGVAVAVALAAEKEGLAQVELSSPVQQVHQAMWRPEYPQIEPI
jgi:malate dehydrogenase (oxaloacetate-decarboxylating)